MNEVLLLGLAGSIISTLLLLKSYFGVSKSERPSGLQDLVFWLVMIFDVAVGVFFVFSYDLIFDRLNPFLYVLIGAAAPLLTKSFISFLRKA
jgi:hypothetical protein